MYQFGTVQTINNNRMKIRNNLCVLAFLASASMAMATIAPVASVTINNVPGSPPQYWLQSIMVGSDTFNLSSLATGTSSGTATGGGAPYNNIGNMDNFDLNLFAARSGQTPPEITTLLFGGANWVDSNGALADFFLFEASGGGNPDDVGVAAIFTDDSVGIAIDLPQTVSATGWGNTGLSISAAVNNGQPITGVSWDITDLKDASGNFLTSSSVIKGIRIMNTTLNTQASGLDPCLLAAVVPVPEPGTMALALLGLGGLALFRKRF